MLQQMMNEDSVDQFLNFTNGFQESEVSNFTTQWSMPFEAFMDHDGQPAMFMTHTMNQSDQYDLHQLLQLEQPQLQQAKDQDIGEQDVSAKSKQRLKRVAKSKKTKTEQVLAVTNQPLKKKRGRSKIAMAYIEDENRRKTTEEKRKKGLLKKSAELGILTGNACATIVHNPQKKRFDIFSNLKHLPQFLCEAMYQAANGAPNCKFYTDDDYGRGIENTKNSYEGIRDKISPGRKRKTAQQAESNELITTGDVPRDPYLEALMNKTYEVTNQPGIIYDREYLQYRDNMRARQHGDVLVMNMMLEQNTQPQLPFLPVPVAEQPQQNTLPTQSEYAPQTLYSVETSRNDHADLHFGDEVVPTQVEHYKGFKITGQSDNTTTVELVQTKKATINASISSVMQRLKNINQKYGKKKQEDEPVNPPAPEEQELLQMAHFVMPEVQVPPVDNNIQTDAIGNIIVTPELMSQIEY